MKKKITVFITALVMVFACALGLVACGNSFDEGTYVVWSLTEVAGKKIAVSTGQECEFEDGKVTMDGESGTYKVDGDKLTLSGDNISYTLTKTDNYWSYSMGFTKMAYVKKGETPTGYEVKDMSDLGDLDFDF